MNVALSFDNLGEAYDLLRFGHAGGAFADGVYAIRRGIPRVLDMLDRHGLRATFFVEGWGAEKYSDLVREITSAGHEIGAHGWLHEQWNELDFETERELIKRTTATIGDVVGSPPVGWRSPWARTTPNTLTILADEGYKYDSSFVDDDVPYRLAVAPGNARTLIELPFSQMLNDTPFYNYPGTLHSPAEAMGKWWSELEGLAETCEFAVVTAHPRFSGRPARIRALGNLIQRLVDGELGEMHFLRCDEAAVKYAESAQLPRYPAPAVLASS